MLFRSWKHGSRNTWARLPGRIKAQEKNSAAGAAPSQSVTSHSRPAAGAAPLRKPPQGRWNCFALLSAAAEASAPGASAKAAPSGTSEPAAAGSAEGSASEPAAPGTSAEGPAKGSSESAGAAAA